ncbi:MAG: Zn-dependent hydrolase [Deltaproteobacteria bacterium]|nr:Zn-dependent hydrolase [Deltaproteobacteria bacterium]
MERKSLTAAVSSERIQQDMATLACIGADGQGGVTRLAYSPEHWKARAYIRDRMESAGLQVREDAAGNVMGRWPVGLTGPALAMGSHLDSVPHGGRFDGPVGVVCALEAVRAIQESGFRPPSPLEVIVFAEEEGARLNHPLFGSKAMAGILDPRLLEQMKDRDGVPLARVLEGVGLSQERLSEARRQREEFLAYLEVHIEQGSVLEERNVQIGVVTGIVGITFMEMVITGRADHAGPNPMERRKDALLGAGRIITEIPVLVAQTGSAAARGTVGAIHAHPNTINVVPGRVTLGVDVRHKEKEEIRKLARLIDLKAGDICQKSGLEFLSRVLTEIEPVAMANNIVQAIGETCEEMDITCMQMLSGAGHDTTSMSTLAPVGMIFVPSVEGLSHCPEEFTPLEDIVCGARVLAGTAAGLINNFT